MFGIGPGTELNWKVQISYKVDVPSVGTRLGVGVHVAESCADEGVALLDGAPDTWHELQIEATKYCIIFYHMI